MRLLSMGFIVYYSMTTVHVFGANGMLGSYVTQYLSEQGLTVNTITRQDYNLSSVNSNSLDTFLTLDVDIKQGDIVIN